MVDVPTDGHDWDAAVVDAQEVEVGAGEDWWLDLAGMS